MSSFFTSPPPWIAPSIIAANPLNLREELHRIEQSGAELLHLDVMDGNFVPNITMGPWIIHAIRRSTSLPLDLHLMIAHPGNMIQSFIECEPTMLSIHWETSPHLHRIILLIQERGIKAGVAINPGTPVSQLEALLPVLDYVVVMSVNPGFSGQEFLPFVIPKINWLNEMRKEKDYRFWIEVDGGVTPENSAELLQAGADILVAGYSFFSASDPREAYHRLKGVPCPGSRS